MYVPDSPLLIPFAELNIFFIKRNQNGKFINFGNVLGNILIFHLFDSPKREREKKERKKEMKKL